MSHYLDSRPSGADRSTHAPPYRAFKAEFEPRYDLQAPPPYSEDPQTLASGTCEIRDRNQMAPRRQASPSNLTLSGRDSDYTTESALSFDNEKPESSESAAAESELFDRVLDFTHRPAAVTSATVSSLRLPVVIPQCSARAGSPMSRAYAPVLASHDISEQDFLALIDGFNIVSASNPGLVLLGLASNGLNFIPWHHAQLLAFGVGTAVNVGHIAMMKIRGARYIERVNEEFLRPRGLKASMVGSKTLREILDIPVSSKLVAPMEESAEFTSLERKMAALDGRVEPLDYHVAAPQEESSAFRRFTSKQQAWLLKKAEQKMQKERAKDQKESVKELAKDEKEWTKKEREWNKECKKKQKEWAKERTKKQKEVAKEQRKQQKKSGMGSVTVTQDLAAPQAELVPGMSKIDLKFDKLRHDRDMKLLEAQSESSPEKRLKEEAKAHEKFEEKASKLASKENVYKYSDERKTEKLSKTKSKDKEAKSAEKVRWLIIENL